MKIVVDTEYLGTAAEKIEKNAENYITNYNTIVTKLNTFAAWIGKDAAEFNTRATESLKTLRDLADKLKETTDYAKKCKKEYNGLSADLKKKL